jgi:hypothetical protein
MKKFGNLRIEVRDVPEGQTVIEWSGESDAIDPAAILSPYLRELAVSLKGKSVRLRFGSLEYMNSSTVTPLMAFIRDLSGTAASVVVLYRADLQWQATSFRAMRVVARKWPNVQVTGE